MAAPQVPKKDGIEEWVGTTNQVGSDLGDIAALTVGTSAVGGINVLDAELGDLTTLETSDQTSIVNALNETKKLAFVMSLVLGTPLN